jgi:hypothetical protein
MGIGPAWGVVAWYRFRVTLRRRWGGYLALALLIGLVGGIALGSAAAARRTESSFPVFLASTNPSDLSVQFGADDYAGLPPFARAVARLPQVRRAGIAVEPIGDVLGPDGGRRRRAWPPTSRSTPGGAAPCRPAQPSPGPCWPCSWWWPP